MAARFMEAASCENPFQARGVDQIPIIGMLSPRSYRTIQIEPGKHLDGALIAFMNHSCRPTSIVKAAERGVYASTDLKAEDEVTFFYLPPNGTWLVRLSVSVGARTCIEFVAGAQYLPVHILGIILSTPIFKG
jgi:hypothetical protein